VRWGARRGEREREALGVELADEIGEREGGARGRGKPQCGGGTAGGKQQQWPWLGRR
jgi:hypothetical protein